MMFVEVLTTSGSLTERQRERINTRFIEQMTGQGEDGAEAAAPEEVLRAARGLFQLAFHEADAWFVAGQRIGEGQPSRFVVRATVPHAWLQETSAHLIKTMTGILAEIDGGERLYEEPHAWIHVVGVADGSIGAFGKPLSGNDIVKLITKSHRESPKPPSDLPPEKGFDPVCGMTVPWQHAAGTAEHGGVRYAFCSRGCREVFVEEHPDAA
ncbi:YHS domain-containing protein [Saccharomonospora amisosensis]|uniref:YHS domain-containing protein n=1 Tax=Saccharomonospora amisosensis TaxID=1128677 RepID=A0A7X5ZSB2_9PSEU|nr:YHS domain-containing protein [Saccharomonospora amisosensis]NIJ13779.1 YHS domain-containing protein [Saccharomonospora amisosensis]